MHKREERYILEDQMKQQLILYKGPAKHAKKAMEDLKFLDKTIEQACNNNVIVRLLKHNFNQLEPYSVVEYEYNEDAQDILDSLQGGAP